MFVILGKNNQPLYEYFFSKDYVTGLFSIHAALDLVEEKLQRTNILFLSKIDNYNGKNIYCFVTISNIKFLLQLGYEQTNLQRDQSFNRKEEEYSNKFFKEIYEIYVKAQMNPLYEIDSKLNSVYFDEKVMECIKRLQKNIGFTHLKG